MPQPLCKYRPSGAKLLDVIPYFNRLPYSRHPVRRIHVVLIVVFLLLLFVSCYLLGGLPTLRLLLFGMLLYSVGLGIYLFYLAIRALRTREMFTLYGRVGLAERPVLFLCSWLLLVLLPIALLGFLIFLAQEPDIHILHWISAP